MSDQEGRTRELNLTVEIREENGLFLADCLELDIATFGETPEEAQEMIEDALRGFVETAPFEEIDRRIAAYKSRRGSQFYTTRIQVPTA